MEKLFLCFLAISAAGCSEPSDPIVKEGFEALDTAYVIKVKPQDASFTKCAYKALESQHVVRCGISFGSTELAQKGFWEIETSSGKFVAYAMNGKALSALEKIGASDQFKSGAGRAPLNIQNAEATFDGR